MSIYDLKINIFNVLIYFVFFVPSNDARFDILDNTIERCRTLLTKKNRLNRFDWSVVLHSLTYETQSSSSLFSANIQTHTMKDLPRPVDSSLVKKTKLFIFLQFFVLYIL